MQIKKLILLIASAALASANARADDLDIACGSYRRAAAEQRERCARIQLALDRAACVKESATPATDAYSACIISFNKNGAKKTIQKQNDAKRQKPIPDATGTGKGATF